MARRQWKQHTLSRTLAEFLLSSSFELSLTDKVGSPPWCFETVRPKTKPKDPPYPQCVRTIKLQTPPCDSTIIIITKVFVFLFVCLFLVRSEVFDFDYMLLAN